MDALTQLIEVYISENSNPMTDAFCRDGIATAARSIRTAYAEGSNLEARADMCLAALYSGIALANARLGAVHGIAGPLGGLVVAPHGALCARLLPAAMSCNLRVDRAYGSGGDTELRYDEIARLLTGNSGASAHDGVAFVEALVKDFAIPSLSDHGLAPADFPLLIRNAEKSSSMKGNPYLLKPAEIESIVQAAM
jgi:alcohol dehydrogenase class IV